MARKLQTLYQVEGVLTAKTALHVGGSGASLTEDMPLARNGKGELYFPGTSLTGPMRNWWVSRYSKADADFFLAARR